MEEEAEECLSFQLLSGCHANKCPYTEEDEEGVYGATGVYLRLYGMTGDGQSVAMTVYNWRPYLYVRLPEGGDARLWQNAVLRRLNSGLPSLQIRRVQVESYEQVWRRKLDGFSNEDQFPFLKLVLKSQPEMRRCTQLMRQPLEAAGCGSRCLDLYEANVAPFTRFCVDHRLVTSAWVRVPWRRLARVQTHNKRTVSPLEVCLRTPSAMAPIPDRQDIAPIVVASFDIECASADGSFPDPRRPSDKCIQIATAFQRYGHPEPYLRHIVCLRACDAIPDVQVVVVQREEEVLLTWSNLIRDQNADVLLGYNILKFDLQFMYERAQLLQVSSVFSQLGRDRYQEVRFVTKVMASNAAGSNEYQLWDAAVGRVQLDLLPLVRQSHKLEFYSLNFVCEKLLDDKKVDLSPGRLFELWNGGTAEGLTEIAVYCCKDVDLPLRLMERLKTIPNLIEMSRVCQVAVDDLITRGQQIKVLNQILKFTHDLNMLVPTPDSQDDSHKPPDEKFQGATVIEPKRGAYIDASLGMSASEGVIPGCVTCLDFKSLYPSIMRGWNLCYSTLVYRGDPYDDVPGVRYTEYARNAHGVEYRFALNRPGVLPRILEALADARTAAKREMKRTQDPNMRSVLDGKQLALKVSANSIYGFTGVTRGFLPQREIAETVTRNGRRMIEETSRIVTASYPRSEVVYGDSVLPCTPVTVRDPHGRLRTMRIDELSEVFGGEWTEWRHARKQRTAVITQAHTHYWQAWTEDGWDDITGVVRHCGGSSDGRRIMRVRTRAGIADVTEDHSLVTAQGHVALAGDLSVGSTRLMHWSAVPELCCERPLTPWWSRLLGTFMRRGDVTRHNEWYVRGPLDVLRRSARTLPDGELGRLRPSSVQGRRDEAELTIPCCPRLCDRFRALFWNRSGERRVPPCVLNADVASLTEFLVGYMGCNDALPMRFGVTEPSKEAAAGLHLVCARLGMSLTVCTHQDEGFTVQTSTDKASQEVVREVRVLRSDYTGPVYDLETRRTHHFSVGPGRMVVHNTDSVMVLFRHPDGRPATLQESFDLGERAATEVTKTFPPPVELEFEKVNRNFLLFKKKRYVGFKFEHPDEDGVIDAKGIQIVRRDNMPLVREGLMRIVELILRHGDVEGAKAHIRGTVAALLAGEVPTDKLLLSKALSGNYAKLEGHSMPAHVAVAAKRRQRDPNDRVLSGERVPYVFVTLPGRTARDLKKTKQAERAECPAYVAANGLRLDYEFYFDHQLKKPLDQLMGLIVANPSDIYREPLRVGLNRLRGLQDITTFFKRKSVGGDETCAVVAGGPPPDGGIFSDDE